MNHSNRLHSCPRLVTVTGLMLAAITSAFGATKTASATWSGAVAVSPVCQPDPTRGSQLNDVAVNAHGLAIAAWDQYSYNNGGGATIGAAVQSGGKWSAPFTVSGLTGFSMSPKVAVGGDGTLAVSWTYQDPATLPAPQQKIQIAVKPAASSVWTTTTLAQGPIGGVAILQTVPLAVDAYGNITAVWSLWNGSSHDVQSAFLSSGGTWSGVVNLAPGTDGMFPSLALNARGDAAVAFCSSAYAAGGGTAAYYVSRPGLFGSWSAPSIVSEILSSTVGYVSNPMVAFDGNGLATVGYLAYGVECVRQLSPTTWTAPQTVLRAPTSTSSFTSIDLVSDQFGDAIVAASIFDATIGVDRASVWVSIGTPLGSWSTPQRLTDPAANVDAYATRLALSPDGSLAFVGWIDHYHGVVQVSRLLNGIWGSPLTIGRGTAFSSFQEVLSLDSAAGNVARAVWKNAKTGTQTMASTFGQ